MDTTTGYRGVVTSGVGVARIRVADNLDLYERKTGMRFFPGTQNVLATRPLILPRKRIDIPGREILTTGRETTISLVPARVFGELVYLLYPHNPLHNRNVIEILAPFNARERYGLRDGDRLQIEVES